MIEPNGRETTHTETLTTQSTGVRRTLTTAIAIVAALGLLTGGALASDAPNPLEGQWDLAETADEKSRRMESIDEATKGMRSMQRNMARDMLKERTSPPENLLIDIEGALVTIGSGDKAMELELDGEPISVPGSDGKAKVSATMDGDKLIVTADTGKGGRTTSYRADGDRLTVDVSMTGGRIDGPVEYSTTYVKSE
jgi:hypothetical protein